MNTECNASQLEFQGVGSRKVVADFDGGHLSSDGGSLLLRELDTRLSIMERFAGCFTDYRDPESTEHSVLEMLRQRVYGIALGYEDLNDHKDLSSDPLLALVAGKEDLLGERRRRESDRGKALASTSTLNRLELTPDDANAASRYHKVVYRQEAVEDLLVDLFVESFATPPEEIVLDFDATDDPLHGAQEGRFFHGYYDCYCYMPLYVTCGDHLLAAKLRTADRDASTGSVEVLARLVARIRARWPSVRIILRGDSGFAREAIMAWCETNKTYYLLGLARNQRLLRHIEKELDRAKIRQLQTGVAARVFRQFTYQTLNSWSRERRVIGKAEQLSKGANPRFIVTNLPGEYAAPQDLYEQHYCARGDMENRIKEQQLDLFADRTSCHTMRANQLRLFFSSMAYALLSALRRIGLAGTSLARATCGTIRLKLLKIGAQVKLSVRRVLARLPTAYPYKNIFTVVLKRIQNHPLRI